MGSSVDDGEDEKASSERVVTEDNNAVAGTPAANTWGDDSDTLLQAESTNNLADDEKEEGDSDSDELEDFPAGGPKTTPAEKLGLHSRSITKDLTEISNMTRTFSALIEARNKGDVQSFRRHSVSGEPMRTDDVFCTEIIRSVLLIFGVKSSLCHTK